MSVCDKSFAALIEGHFGSGLAPAQEARLRSHLPTCSQCRQAYETFQMAERLDPRSRGPRARLAIALGLAVSRPPLHPALRWGLGPLLVGGVAGLVLLIARPHFSSDVASRGPGVAVNAASPDVAIYRLIAEGRSERVRDHVLPHDELAFAYRNEGGKSFLMVFAVDERRTVFWYHPAWTDPGSSPKAIPITTQLGFRELPEAIRQPLPEGRVVVHALFTERPLDVVTVEERVRRAGASDNLADASAGEIDRVQVLTVQR